MSVDTNDIFEGYLETKLNKKWKLRFFIITGSSAHIYKTELDDKPESTIEFAGCTLIDDPKNKLNEHKNSFHIIADGKTFQFKAINKDRQQEWCNIFKTNTTQPKTVAPTKTQIAKSKRTLKDKITRNAVAKVGGSGTASFVMNDEISNLLKAIKKLIEIDAGKDKSKKAEKFIMKLVAKSYMEWQHKNITNAQIVALDKPIREAFYNKAEYLTPGFEKLVTLLNNQIKNELLSTLRPCLSPKNLSKLRDLFTLFFNVEFFQRVWSKTDPADGVGDSLFDIVNVMNQYNSFPLNLPNN
ncbi:PH domain-containing protein [Entamoeba marina]